MGITPVAMKSLEMKKAFTRIEVEASEQGDARLLRQSFIE
jgi:hypothetical protein